MKRFRLPAWGLLGDDYPLPTLAHYVSRDIYTHVTTVLVAFLCVFAFFDLVGELDDVGRGGYEIQHALIYVALSLPGRIYELSPLAALIGALYSLTQLARHSEVTVMRASGLSTGRFMRLLGKISLPMVLLTFLVGEFAAPVAEKAAQEWRLQHTQSGVSNELRSGVWVRDGRYFVNIREVMPDGTLRGVRLYEFTDGLRMTSMAEAKRGEHDGDKGWHLQDVSRTLLNGQTTQVETLAELSWISELNPQMLAVLMVSPERMSLVTLYSYIHHLQDNAQKTEQFEVAFWKKLSYPFAVFVMLVLALPFGYLNDRMGGMSWKVFSGVMIGIGFHLLNGLFSSLGVINSWPPFLSAWIPSLLFLLGAGGFMWWVEHR